MMARPNKKLSNIVLADPDPKVRDDLGRVFTRLAAEVNRFEDGDDAIAFILSSRPEIAVVSLDCWPRAEDGIGKVKVIRNMENGTLVVTHRKLLPKHLGKLSRMRIKNVVGHPMDPLHLFRIANRRFGVIARRYDRINVKKQVFWGAEKNREIIGRTQDISRGGILLISKKQFAEGDSMFIGIQLDEHTVVELRGEVIKIDTDTFAPEIAYGMAFVDIPIPSGMLLEEAVESFKDEGAGQAPVTFVDGVASEQGEAK